MGLCSLLSLQYDSDLYLLGSERLWEWSSQGWRSIITNLKLHSDTPSSSETELGSRDSSRKWTLQQEEKKWGRGIATLAKNNWRISINRFCSRIISWENPAKSSVFLIGFVLVTWFFQLWMIPFSLTLVLMRELLYKLVTGSWRPGLEDLEEHVEVVSNARLDQQWRSLLQAEDDKKSTLEKIQNTVFHIQQFFGSFSSFFERIENVFNVSIPFLSVICLVAMVLFTFVLYILPLRLTFLNTVYVVDNEYFRILIIIWGVNKLTKKLIRPWATSNNEMMDFLSRVPDRVQLVETLISISGTFIKIFLLEIVPRWCWFKLAILFSSHLDSLAEKNSFLLFIIAIISAENNQLSVTAPHFTIYINPEEPEL